MSTKRSHEDVDKLEAELATGAKGRKSFKEKQMKAQLEANKAAMEAKELQLEQQSRQIEEMEQRIEGMKSSQSLGANNAAIEEELVKKCHEDDLRMRVAELEAELATGAKGRKSFKEKQMKAQLEANKAAMEAKELQLEQQSRQIEELLRTRREMEQRIEGMKAETKKLMGHCLDLQSASLARQVCAQCQARHSPVVRHSR